MYCNQKQDPEACLTVAQYIHVTMLLAALAAMKLSREQQQWEHAQHDWEHWKGRVQDEIEAAQV